MSTPHEDAGPAAPIHRADLTFHEIRDGRRVKEMAVDARGSAAFVTRMAEAAARAFEEETTR
ncbi:hypothetical protein [Streptomyces sp. NPDC053560]|uniref:hypothetical protein n=1 Tax=Streptomyces sp. NPDC053560 TaxID=3365711 RepID=UPI0037D7943D